MNPTSPKRKLRALVTTIGALALLVAITSPVKAVLSGTTFDALDGNLVVEPGETDWCLVQDEDTGVCTETAPHFNAVHDKPTGQGDDSLGGKEDDAVPSVGSGSIPNNKSDLTRMYVAHERTSGDKIFLYLAWERVQDPTGTTLMDFEFNRNKCEYEQGSSTPTSDSNCSANGVTPVRSAGDVLIVYGLPAGSTTPALGYHEWIASGTGRANQVCEASNSFPCWGKRKDLAGFFEGAVNAGTTSDPIEPAPATAPRDLSPRTFGEASINLTDAGLLQSTAEKPCTSFGSVYLKSRSSDQFTSQLKDFIAPEPVNVSNCGFVEIEKDTQPDDPQDFTFDVSPAATTGNVSQFLLDDDGSSTNALPKSRELNALGGTYTITEQQASGFGVSGIVCDGDDASSVRYGSGTSFTRESWQAGDTGLQILLTADSHTRCTFTNTKAGTITVVKQTDPDGDPAGFTFSGTVQDTIGDGEELSASVAPGTYTVTEVEKAGWDLTDIACDDADSTWSLENREATFEVAAGENVTCTFTNTERGSITVAKRAFGQDATFDFTGDLGEGGGFSIETSDGSGSQGFSDLVPGTYAVTETGKGGWDLTGLDCDDDDSDTPSTMEGATATVELDPGEEVTCTFDNTRRGAIGIAKEVEGHDGTFGFSGDLGEGGGFSITTDGGSGSEDFSDVVPDTYEVTEAGEAGYDLTGIVCGGTATVTIGAAGEDDFDEVFDEGDDTVRIVLGANQTASCTFTNTEKGRITVAKVTDPEDSEETFEFTGEITDTLSDGGSSSATVEPGTYKVSETGKTGWDLTDISCDDDDSSGELETGEATFEVAAGEHVICTFTNTEKGRITVAKVTDPEDSEETFEFTGEITDTLSDGGSSSATVEPGTYKVSETGKTGWDLTDISCDDDDSSGELETGEATFEVAAGEHVTCTFTNTQRGSITVVKVDDSDAEAPVKGAEFGLFPTYPGEDDEPDVTCTTDDEGTCTFDIELEPGTYWVKELGDPTGYNGDPDARAVTVGAGEAAEVRFTNARLFKVIVLVCQKGNDLQGPRLYASSVDFGSGPVTSLGAAPDGIDEEALCQLDGATLNLVEASTIAYNASITIGHNPQP